MEIFYSVIGFSMTLVKRCKKQKKAEIKFLLKIGNLTPKNVKIILLKIKQITKATFIQACIFTKKTHRFMSMSC